MATAPVSYQSALIESLRAASPGFGSNNPGVMLLDNPANSKTVIKFNRTPTLPPGPVVGPPLPPGPTPAPSLPPPVIGPGPGGGPGGPPVIGPGPGPVVGPVGPSVPPNDVVPVPDYTDDLWGPDTPPPPPAPAPDGGDDVATPLPVPDPSPLEPVDLPPLPGPPPAPTPPGPSDDGSGGVPVPDYTNDLWGPTPPDDVPVPDYTDDLWPPVYDEIPQGEIDVVAPGSSQPARDAIDRIGNITELGDPLDELGDIEVPEPIIDPPPVPSPSEGGGSGGSGDVYFRPSRPSSVSDNPLDEWEWIEPDVPEIPLPEIPSSNFSFSDAELMDMLFGDYFGGGGSGGLGGMNLYMQE